VTQVICEKVQEYKKNHDISMEDITHNIISKTIYNAESLFYCNLLVETQRTRMAGCICLVVFFKFDSMLH